MFTGNALIARCIAACAVGGVGMFATIVGPGAAPSGQLAQGRQIFRYDTFGDEQLWTDSLRMHEVIEDSVDPLTAFSVGLKVDADALPAGLRAALLNGRVDLTDPATTVALLKLDAVVGVKGRVLTVNGEDRLVSVGVTCALCHSTVDDSLMPNVGRRLDGWPNIDLNPGAIIGLSPAVSDEARAVYNSWGPGKYDPRFNIDGLSTPLVLPPAYGLRNVKRETFTGDGKLPYWNNYVAVTQMGGHGTFVDNQLGIRIIQHPDLVRSKLPALRAYQLSLQTPPAPEGSFDPVAAAEGRTVFNGAANCRSCHRGAAFTDINQHVLHDAAAVGQDGAYAERTKTGRYRTTPLRGLWQHPPYFHDGSAATLMDVVDHYDARFDLGLTPEQKHNLVEYLKSI